MTRPTAGITERACVLIADDLTGACDAAVAFAATGLRTVVPLTPEYAAGNAQVVAFSTESRDLDPAEASCVLRRLAGRVRAENPRLIFKKIDSTLRGNSGVETVAALDAFACEAAIVNPAFPAMGRIVEAGRLRLAADGAFEPIEIVGWLTAHGARACRHVRAGAIAAALDSGARFVSLDAVCEGDLAAVAAEALASGRRILWAGSGGLAAALAGQIGTGEAPAGVPESRGPVLFAIGSDHPVTIEQQRRVVEERGAAALDARSAGAAQIHGALAERRHVLLRVARGQVAPERLARLLGGCRPAALALSGGDTASLVCRALGVEAIALERELARGIPIGVLRGGSYDGMTVITKSGGFGSPGDLIRIADHFHA